MFKPNKYTRWYFSIVESAKNRMTHGYSETHHIIPKCLNGLDTADNLVKLTAREHFICHLLLTKMHDSAKLKYALICLTLKNQHQRSRYVPTSKIYEKIKQTNAELAKERFTGNQKHNVGKKRAYNPITNEIKMFFENDIPNDWILGNSPEMKKSQSGKNKNKTYYHNPDSKEVIALSEGEKIPHGFIKGNVNSLNASKKAAEKNTGTILCYDPITLKSKRCKEIPNGWIKGSIFIWANNGIENKQYMKNQPLPEGWVKGRLIWR